MKRQICLLIVVCAVFGIALSARPRSRVQFTITDLGPLDSLEASAAGKAVSHRFLSYLNPADDCLSENGGPVRRWKVEQSDKRPCRRRVSAFSSSGEMAGSACAHHKIHRASLFTRDSVIDLGTFGGERSDARALNAAGVVVGWASTLDGSAHAFWYRNGIMKDLGTFGGANSFATDVNASGDVAGSAETPMATTHAFLYRSGVARDLGTLEAGEDSFAMGLNDAGDVVGHAITRHGAHAFLFRDGRLYDLNQSIPSRSPWVLETALDIDNSGAIVGCGRLHGSTHAFLLTPR